jgi:hypothetical protein
VKKQLTAETQRAQREDIKSNAFQESRKEKTQESRTQKSKKIERKNFSWELDSLSLSDFLIFLLS